MKRRQMLKAIPAVATIPAIAVLPALAQASRHDPMTLLCREFVSVHKEWEMASDLPGEGNFDGPVSAPLGKKWEDLLGRIKEMEISSDAGFEAFCQMVDVDNYLDEATVPDMRDWQWAKIKRWATARASLA